MSLFSESGGSREKMPDSGFISSQFEVPSNTNHLKCLINALIDRVFSEKTLKEPASSVASTSVFEGRNTAMRGKKSFSMGSSAEMIQEEEEESQEKEYNKNG